MYRRNCHSGSGLPTVKTGSRMWRQSASRAVMRYVIAGLLLFLVAGGLSVIRAETAGARAETLDVFVSILPQEYFVERIGGEFVDVHVLVGPGQSPETYSPTPQQMSAMARAEVYFRIGMPFETFMEGSIASAFKNLEVVDTQRGVKRLYFAGRNESYDSTAGSPDPHIWMNPMLVKEQAQTIEFTLSRLAPEHADLFAENLARFDHDLDSVNAEVARILAPCRGKTMYAFHPAYGYFAEGYGLKQVAIEEEGKEPSARELSEVIDEMKAAGNHVIFVQPQFSERMPQTIAEAIDGRVVALDPLAEDYLTNLVTVAKTVAGALSNSAKVNGDDRD